MPRKTPKQTVDLVIEMLSQEITPKAVAKRLGVAYSTVHRLGFKAGVLQKGYHARMSAETKAKAKAAFDAGFDTCVKLSREIDISKSYAADLIKAIREGRT